MATVRNSASLEGILAHKLRLEYQDFMSAEGQPMTERLGENMRDQLKAVFEILKRNGIKLEA
jgi:hypothetical protein